MMTIKDIWKLDNGTIVAIGNREYEYKNIDGRRVITDIVIGDSHDVDEWFSADEEIQWVAEQV